MSRVSGGSLFISSSVFARVNSAHTAGGIGGAATLPSLPGLPGGTGNPFFRVGGTGTAPGEADTAAGLATGTSLRMIGASEATGVATFAAGAGSDLLQPAIAAAMKIINRKYRFMNLAPEFVRSKLNYATTC
jgi:hypothetical protein